MNACHRVSSDKLVLGHEESPGDQRLEAANIRLTDNIICFGCYVVQSTRPVSHFDLVWSSLQCYAKHSVNTSGSMGVW